MEKQPIKSKIQNDEGIRQNIFNLVDFAYRKNLKEPHVGLKSKDDVLSLNYDYWEAIDIDNRPDADAVIFGKKVYGVKISGIGHNGNIIAIHYLIDELSRILKKQGYWIEASKKVASILKSQNVLVYSNREKIQKMFSDSTFKWFDDNSYIRTLKNGNYTSREYIFGNPII